MGNADAAAEIGVPKPIYQIEQHGKFFQLLAQNSQIGLEMSVIPHLDPLQHRKQDTISVLFLKPPGTHVVGDEFLIYSEDITGLDAFDKTFYEEFGDKYATKFVGVKAYKNFDDLVGQVFPDIIEGRQQETPKFEEMAKKN